MDMLVRIVFYPVGKRGLALFLQYIYSLLSSLFSRLRVQKFKKHRTVKYRRGLKGRVRESVLVLGKLLRSYRHAMVM